VSQFEEFCFPALREQEATAKKIDAKTLLESD